jgi:hypothetical protein
MFAERDTGSHILEKSFSHAAIHSAFYSDLHRGV